MTKKATKGEIMTIFKADCFKDTDGKFRGIVVGSDDRAVIWTRETHKTEERAKRYARAQFMGAIYDCQHQWGEWSQEHSEDTSWGGAEYVSAQECEKCGLHRWNVSDKEGDF
jgi:excinuclease UvrABC ATPase subunit